MTSKAMYMSMPQLTAMTHKPWTELSFATLSKASGGVNLSQLIDQAQQTAPAQYIAILTKSGDVHLVGTATIDGVVDAALRRQRRPRQGACPPHRLPLRSAWATLAKQGVKTEHVDVWLDAAGQPRRIQTTLADRSGERHDQAAPERLRHQGRRRASAGGPDLRPRQDPGRGLE